MIIGLHRRIMPETAFELLVVGVMCLRIRTTEDYNILKDGLDSFTVKQREGMEDAVELEQLVSKTGDHFLPMTCKGAASLFAEHGFDQS